MKERGAYLKFSFLSPTYNSEAWIKRMLDSIPKEMPMKLL